MKLTLILTLFFLLSFSAVAGTFLDTFENQDMEAWQGLWVEKGPAAWDGGDEGPAAWEVVDDELRAVSRAVHIHLLTTGDSTWENYTFALDVKPLKKHGIGGISIAVRVKETWLVFCQISDTAIKIGDDRAFQETRIACYAGSLHKPPWAELISEPHPLLKLNSWAHLRLGVEGDIFTLWLNGEEIMAPTQLRIPLFRKIEAFRAFPDFQTGGVGFGLWNYTARFDNITVTGDSVPNSGGFSVTPSGKLATTWGNLKRF